MAKKKDEPVIAPRKFLDQDVDADNSAHYGMGRGLVGNKEGDKDVEQDLG
jgi:hypothetical protein